MDNETKKEDPTEIPRVSNKKALETSERLIRYPEEIKMEHIEKLLKRRKQQCQYAKHASTVNAV